jgi:glycine cleavage system transcriptional repressor
MKESPNTESPRPQLENHLLVSALASNEVPLATMLTRRVLDAGCNLLEARVAQLGREVSVQLLAAGSWDAIVKFESALQRVAREESIQLTVKRTASRVLTNNAMPYAVEVVAADKPGILFSLCEFFARRGISIEALTCGRYKAQITGADMFQAQASIGVPQNTHIAALRDDFLEFCDSQNLDALLEPIKG